MQAFLPITKKIAIAVVSLLLFTQTLQAQINTNTEIVSVSGVVTDEARQPLEGVSVLAGNKILGVTNKVGSFTVIVARNMKLSFTSVGYEIYTLTPSANTNAVNITMKRSEDVMQDVVVTALGITRQERALGYATTTIKGEELTDAMSGNWTDALSGKVAGLNLVRSNSGPAGSNKIILRGENNLTGDNEALIVVDGVIINQGSGRRSANSSDVAYGTGSDNMPADYGSSINDINPEDVESVTVLKGPGASALYGQRGANGAIIITTKSGSTKRKGFGLSLNSNASIEQLNNSRPDLQYEYGQGLDGAPYYSYGASADGASTSATSSAYGPRFNGQLFYQYDPVTQKQGTERTPWIPYPNKVNEYFNTGHTVTNTVSVDGGTDKTTARFSVTNVNNSWITPNTGYKRNTVALSVNSKVNEKLTISSKINYTNKWSDNLPGAGYGNQSIMYWYIFYQPNADPDWLRNYWTIGQEGKQIKYPFSSFPENPYAIASEFINRSNRHGVTGNIQAAYSFTKELTLQLRTSIDLGYENRAQERPYDAGSKLTKGSYRTQNIFSQEQSSDVLLKYAKKVASDFDFSITAGASLLRNMYNRDENRADSLSQPGLFSFANALGPIVAIPYRSKFGINSVYGLFSAAYKRALYLDLTARNDWASPLATPDRTENVGFFYPSASVSYVLTDAFKLPQKISFAKLRFSASSVGSGGIEPYRTAFYYEYIAGFPGALQNPALLANPNLKPLRTITYEAGANVKMFKNRLGIDVALYVGNTKDQHLLRIVDRASGYTQQLINAGKVANQGLEIALNGSPIQNKAFKWTTNIVFSSNQNQVKELLDSSVVLSTGPVGGGQIVAKIGGSMGDLYGRGYVRLPDGQVVYDPVTGNALISTEVQYLGNTIPKYKMGLTNEFVYKQFRLNFLFDAQVGGVAHSLMHYKLAEQGKITSTLPGRYNGIIGNGVVMGTDGKYRQNDVIATNIDEYYRSHYGADNAEGSTFSTDFIKFREARLDFTLNPKMVKKLGLQRATFGVYGRDLFIWSPWPMFDPEFGTLSGTDIVRGFEIGQFPSTRTLGFNLVLVL